MATARIHLAPKQRQRLARRAKKTREIPELDRRLIRLQAKFALSEHLGRAARRALPEPKQE
jgi:hypothetical protein